MPQHQPMPVAWTEQMEAVARGISQAEAHGSASDPTVADGLDVAAGYAVQDRTARRAERTGRRAAGFKIGLTTPEARRSLGADEPGSGRIFADRVLESPATVALQARRLAFEVEVGVLIGRAGRAVAWCPAIEIVASRWDGGPPNPGGWVADNASADSVCLGRWIDGPLPRTAAAWADSGRERLSGETSSAADNLAWLDRHLGERNIALADGSIVLTGSIIGPVPVPDTGMRLTAGVAGSDALRLEFAAPAGSRV